VHLRHLFEKSTSGLSTLAVCGESSHTRFILIDWGGFAVTSSLLHRMGGRAVFFCWLSNSQGQLCLQLGSFCVARRIQLSM
jgi:hypothetical protein